MCAKIRTLPNINDPPMIVCFFFLFHFPRNLFLNLQELLILFFLCSIDEVVDM